MPISLILVALVCMSLLMTMYIKALHTRDHLETFETSSTQEPTLTTQEPTSTTQEPTSTTVSINDGITPPPLVFEDSTTTTQQPTTTTTTQEPTTTTEDVVTTTTQEPTTTTKESDGPIINTTIHTPDPKKDKENDHKGISKNSEVQNNYYKFNIDIDANNNKLLSQANNSGFKDYLLRDTDSTQLTDFKTTQTQPSETNKNQSVNFNINHTCRNSLLNRYDYTMVDKNKWMIPKQYKSQNPACLTKNQPNFKPSARLTDGVPLDAFEYQKLGKKLF